MARLLNTSHHSSETKSDTVSALGISTFAIVLEPHSPAPSSITGAGILRSQVGAQSAQMTPNPKSAGIRGSEGPAPQAFFGLVRADALVSSFLRGSGAFVTRSKAQSSQPWLAPSLLAEQVTPTPTSSPSAAKLQQKALQRQPEEPLGNERHC